MKYNVIKEDGTVMKTFDTYEAAERYYNYMDGVIEVFSAVTEEYAEEYIYIQEVE